MNDRAASVHDIILFFLVMPSFVPAQKTLSNIQMQPKQSLLGEGMPAFTNNPAESFKIIRNFKFLTGIVSKGTLFAQSLDLLERKSVSFDRS